MQLRNPGEFLESKILELNNKFNAEEKKFILQIGVLFGFACFLTGMTINAPINLLFGTTGQNILSLIILTTIFILFVGSKILNKKIQVLDKEKEKIDKAIYCDKKGIQGERNTAYYLSRLQSKNKNFYVINNFQYIKKNGGTTDIDHIVICEKGVFTVETKNYSKIHPQHNEKILTQARGEGIFLRNTLRDKGFHINFVTPILTFTKDELNNQLKDAKNIAHVVRASSIGYTIDSSKYFIEENEIEKIFDFLIEHQAEK